ncbi:MAG: NAD-dependent epimerase/dehydratase family protein [Oscillospiraceae bacterium]|nr:NAD-dependent epimerase/dehydratase family protein [Oscillospiraceae bacterium]
MDILITGGTVFASRYAAEYFSKRGHEVYVLNRGSRSQAEGVHHICCDRHALDDTLKGFHFDAVLDITSYDENDVIDLHSALGGYGVYIFISSSAVYPETLSQPFCEDMTIGPNKIWGDYGIKKIAAEKYISDNIPDHYIIRPPYLYGPMNELYREAFVFECAEADRPFFVPKDGSMPLQFCHIDDMCRFMDILIAQRPTERIYNVGYHDTVDIVTWAKLCYKAVGKEPDIRYVDGSVPQRSYFPFYDYEYILDVARQDALMGDTIPLYEGLCMSYEWYKDNKGLIRKKPLIDFIDANLI